MSDPTIGQRLDAALHSLSLTTSAQGAIGWLVQGEPQKAREALAKLDAEQVEAVSTAASNLAAITKQRLAEQGTAATGDTYVFTVEVEDDSPEGRTAMVDEFRRIAPTFMFDGRVSLTLNGVGVND